MTIPSVQTGVTASDLTATASHPGAQKQAHKIEQSSQQFEAMLVREALSDTFKPTSATGGAPAPGADIYQGFVTDLVADHIAQGGGLGISHLLQSQLQSSTSTHAHP